VQSPTFPPMLSRDTGEPEQKSPSTHRGVLLVHNRGPRRIAFIHAPHPYPASIALSNRARLGVHTCERDARTIGGWVHAWACANSSFVDTGEVRDAAQVLRAPASAPSTRRGARAAPPSARVRAEMGATAFDLLMRK